MKARTLALVLLGCVACSTAPSEPEGSVEPEGRAAEASGPTAAAAEVAATDDPVPRVLGGVEFTDAELELLFTFALPDAPPPSPTNRFADDPDAAEFGRRFFHDQRFSATDTVSCATCHDPMRGFGDGKRLSETHVRGVRHTPTLWNAAFHRWFFWDGHADSLWAQALRPLENDLEHQTTRLAILHSISDDPTFRAAYERAFGPLPALEDATRFPATGRPVPTDPEHPDHLAWASMAPEDQDAATAAFVNVGKALAAFQRRLVSNDAPFDRFVRGVAEADVRAQRTMTSAARRGYKLFVGKARCHLCHHGPLFSDREFHNTRVPGFEGSTSLDGGRFGGIEELLASEFLGTSRWSDDPTGVDATKVAYLDRTGHNWAEFKTPSLRNVAVTAPYMHNGRFASLEEVVRFYSTLEGAAPVHHRGEKLLEATHLSNGEIRDLVAFLESLTDAAVDRDVLAPE